MLMLVYAGPKMYLGQYSIFKNHHQSSTKLHMDITDAYNEMLLAAKCPDGTPGYALWSIWDARGTLLLREFLRNEFRLYGPEDPIHSQSIYVRPEVCERFFKTYGVRPYTIRQYPGDVVFIPGYCAHEVRPFLTFTFP